MTVVGGRNNVRCIQETSLSRCFLRETWWNHAMYTLVHESSCSDADMWLSFVHFIYLYLCLSIYLYFYLSIYRFIYLSASSWSMAQNFHSILLYLSVVMPFRVTTADHPPHSVLCIFLRRTSHKLVLHPSPHPYTSSPALLLYPQHPSTAVPHIPHLHLPKPSQSRFIHHVSEPSYLLSPSNILLSNPVHPRQSKRKSQHLQFFYLQLCFMSLLALLLPPGHTT